MKIDEVNGNFPAMTQAPRTPAIEQVERLGEACCHHRVHIFHSFHLLQVTCDNRRQPNSLNNDPLPAINIHKSSPNYQAFGSIIRTQKYKPEIGDSCGSPMIWTYCNHFRSLHSTYVPSKSLVLPASGPPGTGGYRKLLCCAKSSKACVFFWILNHLSFWGNQ